MGLWSISVGSVGLHAVCGAQRPPRTLCPIAVTQLRATATGRGGMCCRVPPPTPPPRPALVFPMDTLGTPPPRPGHTESRPSSQGGALLDSLQQWGGGHIPELLPPVPPRLHFRKGDSTLGGGARGCPSGSALVLWGGGGIQFNFGDRSSVRVKGKKNGGGREGEESGKMASHPKGKIMGESHPLH